MKLTEEEWRHLESVRKLVEERGFEFIYKNESNIKLYLHNDFSVENLSLSEVEVFLKGFDIGHYLGRKTNNGKNT